jgi:hypothetical protein
LMRHWLQLMTSLKSISRFRLPRISLSEGFGHCVSEKFIKRIETVIKKLSKTDEWKDELMIWNNILHWNDWMLMNFNNINKIIIFSNVIRPTNLRWLQQEILDGKLARIKNLPRAIFPYWTNQTGAPFFYLRPVTKTKELHVLIIQAFKEPFLDFHAETSGRQHLESSLTTDS